MPFLKSAGGAALITTVIGGLVVTWVTAQIQDRQRERDFQNGIIQLFTQYQLESHRRKFEERTSLLREALELVGQVVSRAGSRIDIDGPAFARRKDAEAEALNAEQKQQIRRQFNETWERWETGKEANRGLLAIYFNATVAKAWAGVVSPLEALISCANDHRPGKPQMACDKHEKASLRAVDQLLESVEVVEELPGFTSRKTIDTIRSNLAAD